MNNPDQKDNVILLCAMCKKPITTYTVKAEELKEAKFICDMCYMEHVEVEGRQQ